MPAGLIFDKSGCLRCYLVAYVTRFFFVRIQSIKITPLPPPEEQPVLGQVRFPVANVFMNNGKVQVNFMLAFDHMSFSSLSEWREDVMFRDMCDICNGHIYDHFPGCPNNWEEV